MEVAHILAGLGIIVGAIAAIGELATMAYLIICSCRKGGAKDNQVAASILIGILFLGIGTVGIILLLAGIDTCLVVAILSGTV